MGLLKYKYRLDNLWLGLAVGIIVPAIFVLVLFMQESDIVQYLVTSLLRISLILNLATFLLAFNLEYDKLAKGILMATILYGLVIAYLYLFPL